MHTLFDLAFNQVKDSFSEVFVHSESLRCEIVIRSSLQAVEGLVICFLPEADLSHLKHRIPIKELLVMILSDLFEV